MSEINKQERTINSILESLDSANNARKAFDTLDQKINESTSQILQNFAELSKNKPEEVFGIRPTEREQFYVTQVITPIIDKISSFDTIDEVEIENDANEITGSAAPALAGLLGGLSAISDVLKSPQGPEILDKILKHTEVEKKFIKDTVKEGTQGVIGLIGKVGKAIGLVD